MAAPAATATTISARLVLRAAFEASAGWGGGACCTPVTNHCAGDTCSPGPLPRTTDSYCSWLVAPQIAGSPKQSGVLMRRVLTLDLARRMSSLGSRLKTAAVMKSLSDDCCRGGVDRMGVVRERETEGNLNKELFNATPHPNTTHPMTSFIAVPKVSSLAVYSPQCLKFAVSHTPQSMSGTLLRAKAWCDKCQGCCRCRPRH